MVEWTKPVSTSKQTAESQLKISQRILEAVLQPLCDQINLEATQTLKVLEAFLCENRPRFLMLT